MKRQLLSPILMLFVSNVLLAQSLDTDLYRTYDGKFNNVENPDWGAVGDKLLLSNKIGYGDGISSPAGKEYRPNPRYASNLLFSQNKFISEPRGLSDYTWVFGQFIDHDLGLTSDSEEFFPIPVPEGDPWFDPNRTGSMIIPMKRNKSDLSTGTSVDNPRRHPNEITAFVDASMVYGSDEFRANWLRSFVGGKLKVSAGNLMPYNTISGELEDEIDPAAPHMDDPVKLFTKHFVAGDVRANENPVLCSFHTLFVREHNRLCDELSIQHPDWDDEMLYQHARKIVGGLIQNILYNEWLPAVGVEIPPYNGYKADVNPQMMNIFTGAAFRLGHTMLSGELMRMDDSGNSLPEGNMTLAQSFFNPQAVYDYNLDPFLKGMSVQVQQNFDAKVVDGVRNFLFGPPGAGGLDLASININRGRERGLPDFNSIREEFGLPKYHVFAQINPDINVWARLMVLYRSVNWIDPWVGFLSEKHANNSIFGETLIAVLKKQFSAVRDGDRFFYLNDPVLSDEEKTMIANTKFSSIVLRNTDISYIQDNVFFAQDPKEVCGTMDEMSLSVATEGGEPVSDVDATVKMVGDQKTGTTDENGSTSFNNVGPCDVAALLLDKSDAITNGVTTLDLVKIQKHIIGTEVLSSPYKMLAADVDNSTSITALDLIHIRKAILGLSTKFPNNGSWRFVSADYVFSNPDHPFSAVLKTNEMKIEDHADAFYTFVGIKTGDVNGSVKLNQTGTIEPRSSEILAVKAENQELVPGQEYMVSFELNAPASVAGYQFELNYDRSALEFKSIQPINIPNLTNDNFGVFQDRGLITTSWNTTGEDLLKNGKFALVFTAKMAGELKDYISLTNKLTKAEAYDDQLQVMDINLEFSDNALVNGQFGVAQNAPNPFNEQTVITYNLPEQDIVNLTIFDAQGRVVWTRRMNGVAGINQVVLTRNDLPENQVLYYKLDSAFGSKTRKMLHTR